MNRQVLKKKPGTLKRPQGMKKVGKIWKKSRTPEQVQVDRIQKEQDTKFYMEIWNNRPHYCEVTGQWLGDEFKEKIGNPSA